MRAAPKPQWQLDAESDAETLAIFAAERGWPPNYAELELRVYLRQASLYVDPEMAAHAAFRAVPGLRGSE